MVFKVGGATALRPEPEPNPESMPEPGATNLGPTMGRRGNSGQWSKHVALLAAPGLPDTGVMALEPCLMLCFVQQKPMFKSAEDSDRMWHSCSARVSVWI